MAPLELVYKQVDGLDLYLDVYVPSSATPSAPVPVILWWHGGGLIQGTRKGSLDVPQPEPHMLRAPETHGICIVSADYRLAPQTRMPGILADCADAMAFVRSAAFKDATGSCVDASKLFVSGSSAGGWLALLTGTGIGYAACGLEAPLTPTGILAIYPITDLQHSFWNTKHRPVSYRSDIISHEEMAAYADPDQPKVAFASFDSTRNIFYHYMVQEGILTSLLLDGTGVAPSSFSIATSLEKCPPPTYIVHGTIDGKVPCRQSQDVYKVMSDKGWNVVYDERPGLDHLFDRSQDEQMEEMYTFMKKVLDSR